MEMVMIARKESLLRWAKANVQTHIWRNGECFRVVEAPTPIGRRVFGVIFMNSSHSSAVSRARVDERTYAEERCKV